MPRIAMLLCDDLGSRIAAVEGEYTDLYGALLTSAQPEGEPVEMVPFRAHDGQLPATGDLRSFDGVMISGSKAGVYEDHAWLPGLFDTVRAGIDAQVPTIGVCFGHQVVAAALGAEVAPFAGGWNLAGIDYRFVAPAPVGVDCTEVRLIAFHRDQVRDVPEGTRHYLTADRCEIAGLVGESVLTVQPHPEFSPAVADAILRSGLGRRFGEAEVSEALERLSGDFHTIETANWMRALLDRQPIIT
ncbi:MAG: type 1 glutamine amidotransferase [Actinomycetota bacterium]|nr:type 1 glutamine amidotransferase [Actinomycetota bacterium]